MVRLLPDRLHVALKEKGYFTKRLAFCAPALGQCNLDGLHVGVQWFLLSSALYQMLDQCPVAADLGESMISEWAAWAG